MWQEIKISLRELIVAIQTLLMQIGHNRPVVCITLDSDHMILVMWGDYFGFLVCWPKCCAVPADIHVFATHGALRRSINVARLRKSEIEFLWIQLEDVIEHGKNKNAKTKLELLQRIYQFLAKVMPKNKQKRSGQASSRAKS